MNKLRFLTICVILVMSVSLAGTSMNVSARPLSATSPTLVALANYSVLGGQAVTCTGSTTTSGAVGVSSGTSITGFPVPCSAGGGTHSNDASAIAAQAEDLVVFGQLDQPCDQSFGAVDLGTTFPAGVGPGVYCSTSSFSLAGNLKLTGSGVWIFKTVSTLIFGNGSSVTGGDPCEVWWRVGSSATLGTTSTVLGNIFALNGINALATGATLQGRIVAQDAGTVTLDSNTISGPTCAVVPPAPTNDHSNNNNNKKKAAVAGLPNTGGGPIRNEGSPWNLMILAGLGVVIASVLGIRTYRRSHLPK